MTTRPPQRTRRPRLAHVLAFALLVAFPTPTLHAQGSRMLAWDQTSPAAGFAITVDGVRSDLGLTPLGPDGTCGCAITPWFLGARHHVVVSAYNAFGETQAATFIVGPTAVAGGPYQGTAASALTVSGAGSSDTTGTIARYEWAWGDGTGSVGVTPVASHVYAVAGTYAISLTVTDSDGASHAAVTSAIVAAPPAPPAVPSTISPAAEATGVAVTAPLTWRADLATSYDVFFGTANPPPLVSAGQSGTTFTPTTSRVPATSYYWRIVARNANGTTTGPVWRFTTAAPAAPAESGLLAAYGFSEGTGVTTRDASGNGRTAILVNAPKWTPGRNGFGLTFNGTNAYVDARDWTALRLTSTMTLSAWVRESPGVSADGHVVAKSDGRLGWRLRTTRFRGGRRFVFALSAPNGRATQRYSETTIAPDTWYHVAAVYDAAAQTLNLYVNGVLDNGSLSGSVPTSQTNANVSVNIGRHWGGLHLKGSIDNVRIYRRALTPADIQTDMMAAIQ